MIISFGDIILDILVYFKGNIAYGSDVEAGITFNGGGSAANVACWINYLGGDVTYIGRIGKDLAGAYLMEDMKKRGVKTHLIEDENAKSGKIIVLVDKTGERTMITQRGVNKSLRVSDIPQALLEKANHLHLSGYILFDHPDPKSLCNKLRELASFYDVTLSLDPSSYALISSFGPEKVLKLTKGFNIIFPNLDEGRTLTGEESPEKIIKALAEYYSVVALKLGSKGCLIKEKDKTGFIELQGKKVEKTEDTTGAGDAFAAGFIKSYHLAKDITMAGKEAISAASECIQQQGGRPPVKV